MEVVHHKSGLELLFIIYCVFLARQKESPWTLLFELLLFGEHGEFHNPLGLSGIRCLARQHGFSLNRGSL